MFDPLDILTRDDSRSQTPIPNRSRDDRERQQPRTGHRREHDPRQDKRSFQERTERALADVGMYRNVSYRDFTESQFGETSLHGAQGCGPHDPPMAICGSTKQRGRTAALIKCSP